jgi:hypothetical protein
MDTFLEAAKGLAELFSGPIKGPGPHHRYELVRGESGELEFQLDEVDVFFDGLMNEMLGTIRPRRSSGTRRRAVSLASKVGAAEPPKLRGSPQPPIIRRPSPARG